MKKKNQPERIFLKVHQDQEWNVMIIFKVLKIHNFYNSQDNVSKLTHNSI